MSRKSTRFKDCLIKLATDAKLTVIAGNEFHLFAKKF